MRGIVIYIRAYSTLHTVLAHIGQEKTAHTYTHILAGERTYTVNLTWTLQFTIK